MLLDTLRLHRRLRQAGMPEKQATLVTEKLASLLTEASATRTDPAEIIAEVENRIGELAPILKSSGG